MRNSILLAKANLNRSKGNTISLTFVMLLVAMFINVGFVMMFGIGGFFDQRAEELNSAHFITDISADEDFAAAQFNFLQQDSRVESIEVHDFVMGGGTIVDIATGGTAMFLFSPIVENQQFNPLTLVDDYLPLTGNYAYIPHFMMIAGNFELGDSIAFDFMGTELNFIIAGSAEDFMFGAMNNFRWRIYVSDEMFADLQQQFPHDAPNGTTILARLYDVRDVGAFQNDFVDYLLDLPDTADSGLVITTVSNFNVAHNAHTMMPVLVGTIMAAFAIIILIVSLIVVRFRINNSIDEGMINIGALKAIGYGNFQIVGSFLLQFGAIAAVGGLAGILLAQLLLPFISTIFGALLAFPWQPGLDIPVMLVMLAVIVACVLLFSLLSTRRIYKLFPLIALRGGTTTHSFKRNFMPLDRFGGPLAFLLAFKDVLNNKKQAIAISLIVLCISMMATSGIASHYAINVNNDAFLTTIVGETFDLFFDIDSPDVDGAFAERVRAMPNVTGVTGFHMQVRIALEDTTIATDVVEDNTVLRGTALVAGRFPLHYNEIAIGTAVMRETGKGIGDWVTVRSGGNEFQFLVTGQTQSVNAGGMVGNITGEGINRMMDMPFQGFAVFLEETVCGFEFEEMLRAAEGDIFGLMLVYDELADEFIESFGGIFTAVAIAILSVVAVIVIATMYLVIKTAIQRKRRELGVQKALGFTTWQLMNQVALNLTPAIIIGAAAGAAISFNTFDAFFALVMGMSGSLSVNIPVPLGLTVLSCVGIVVLAYVVSMAVAWRIRKISAYALVSE
ncbi:MAG: ABC transporter permease [Oscillospiraceae bacterium]|nr:ABC transporter permease [Oscillospiraceae bacterium]